MNILSILASFMNKRVVMDTLASPVTGVLVRFDYSAHGGIGLLLLQMREGAWVLVKKWNCVKRSM